MAKKFYCTECRYNIPDGDYWLYDRCSHSSAAVKNYVIGTEDYGYCVRENRFGDCKHFQVVRHSKKSQSIGVCGVKKFW